ncbi:7-cyano-7-deazaguanine synthase [Candidatus Entotheonellaceae bacterium PAL068K]
MVDAVVIVSGGIDSITLLHYLIKTKNIKPAAITFAYGQKHDKEVVHAREHAARLECPEHLVLDLSPLQSVFANSALVSPEIGIPDILEVMGDPQPPSYVPNRNMIFLALAVAYAETHEVTSVYYGAQRHDVYGYWDTTPQFLDHLNQVYALNRKTPVHILAPFIGYSKTDILRLGSDLAVDYSRTWSCYEGGASACGRCPTCAERLKAFADLGIADPLPYAIRA